MAHLNTMNLYAPQSPNNSDDQRIQNDTIMESVMLGIPTTSTKGIKEINVLAMKIPFDQLIGKRILHQYLKEKIAKLWKPIEPMNNPQTNLNHNRNLSTFLLRKTMA